MPVKLTADGDKLTLLLSGEIDHHSSKEIREEADACILKTHPKEIILDFKNVTFMDSSGIGLIMGRYRLASSYGASVTVTETSAYLKRVMRIAGIDSIVTIKQNSDLTKTNLPKEELN